MSIGDHRFVYQASVLDSPIGDQVPALLGLEDMKKMKAIIDTVKGTFIIPGPGGLKIEYSPGTDAVQMLGEPDHWLLTVNKNLNRGREVGQNRRNHVAVRRLKSNKASAIGMCQSFAVGCPSGSCAH